LQPPAVQQKVKAELRFSEKRYAKWQDFVGMVIEYTRAWVLFEGAHKPQQPHQPQPPPETPKKGNGGSNLRHEDRQPKKEKKLTSTPAVVTDATPGSSALNPATKARHRCLKCNDEYHTVWKCPKLVRGREEAQQLISDHLAARRLAEKQPSQATTRTLAVTASPATNFLMAALAGPAGFPIRAVLDSGSDVTVVTRTWVDRAIAARCDVEVKSLGTPQKTFAFNGAEVEITDYIKVDLAFPVATGGTLLMKNLVCLVQDDELPASCSDLLVSRNVMGKLGFDAASLLSKASKIQKVWDFESYIDPTSGEMRIGALHVPTPDYGGFDGTDMCLPVADPIDVQMVEVRKVHASKVAEAAANGLPADGCARLESLLAKYEDLFRISIGRDPPVTAPPMTVRLKPGAQPVKCHNRRLPLAQREWLRKHIKELVDAGILYRKDDSAWASAPNLVAKPGTDEYRLTIDMRPVNMCLEQIEWPMPCIETLMENLSDAEVFLLLDFFKGYFQFLLALVHQELFAFKTDEGVYASTHIPPGGSGSVAYCQSTVTKIFEEWLYKCLLIWIDNLLIYAKTPEALLENFEAILQRCQEVGLKLNPHKCTFFAKEVKWCGKMISGSGIRHDPARTAALVDMPPPQTGAELLQFVCAANWMRSHIPRFSDVAEVLMVALQRVYKDAGSNKKSRLVKFLLKPEHFGVKEAAAFATMKEAIEQATTLALPDPSQVICVFPDASQDHYGGVITQVPDEDLTRGFAEQRHTPLLFFSGSFKGAQLAWSVLEKEAYAILVLLKRGDYLVQRPGGFRLYTDHRNLTFLLDPRAFNKDIARYTATKSSAGTLFSRRSTTRSSTFQASPTSGQTCSRAGV
jgi:hypothetical protein